MDSQSQLSYRVVDLILIMWLIGQYDLADEYLDRLDSELVGSGRKVHRGLGYKFHLGQALLHFRQQNDATTRLLTDWLKGLFQPRD